MRRRTLLAASLLAAALALIAAAVASAHSRPIRFDPPPGAILNAAPAQVQGWFTAQLRRDPNWTFLQVTDAQGNRVDTGEVNLSADRRQMSVALRPNLPEGRYVVTWRGYDDEDGAIFGDCYAFYIGQAAFDAAYNNKLRLDGGNNSVCARIDVSARSGTPVPGQTPVAAVTPDTGHAEPNESGNGDGGTEDGGGVPAWTLIVGVVLGVIVGGVGGRLLGGRA